MIGLAGTFIECFHACVQARRVYGEDHAAWREQLRRLEAAAREACVGSGECRIVCVAGRLYAGEASLAPGGEISPLASALDRAGLSWLGFTGHATPDELTALVRACDPEANFAALIEGLKGVHTGIALPDGGSGGAGSIATNGVMPHLTLDSTCLELGSSLGAVLSSPGEAARQVVGVVDRLASVVASARTAMLPLASLKTHDEYTYVHTVNVGILSAALAEAVGLRADQVHDIMLGAVLHDIGKQLVPSAILNKGGKLNDEEAAIMKRHPVDGARVLLEAGDLPDVVPIIAFEHHMHLDGGGYPKIPGRWKCNLAGQIVHVADVFDALRTNRPYRAAMSTTEACRVMYLGATREFDPVLLDAFFEGVATRCDRDRVEETRPAA